MNGMSDCHGLPRHGTDEAAQTLIHTVYFGTGQGFLEPPNEALSDLVRPCIVDVGEKYWRFGALLRKSAQYVVEVLVCQILDITASFASDLSLILEYPFNLCSGCLVDIGMFEIFKDNPRLAVADAGVHSMNTVSDVQGLTLGPDRSHSWNNIHAADVTGTHPFPKLDMFPGSSRLFLHERSARRTNL